MMENINEKKIEISDKIIKRLQNDKDTMIEKIEGQEILLNLLYDDMERKNKEIEDLKKQVIDGVSSEERIHFERKKKQFALLCKEIDDEIEKRNEEFGNLKTSIEKLRIKNAKSKPRCSFEWKCKNVVCRFDHSYLNCKINTFQQKAASSLNYTCSSCGMKLESEDHLEGHKKKCQRKNNVNSAIFVKCSICNERFESQSRILRHMKKSHKRDPLKCAKCGKSFDFKTEVENHMEKHLDDEKTAKEISSMIEAVLNTNCEINLTEPSTISKPKSQKKEPTGSTKKKPAKKLRKPVKFEVIEEDLSDDSLAESDEVIEEDLSDVSLAESDDKNKSEISNYKDSSSEEESGGEYDEEIPDAVQ